MLTTKCVWQFHDKREDLQPIFDYFRSIANEAIRIGVEKNITSRFKLHYELYYQSKAEFHVKYIYGALECAASKLKLYKRTKKKKPDAKIPHIWKNHLILDSRSYKITDGLIRIPTNPRRYVLIKLASYVLTQIKNVKLGSITITENKIIISYSKNITEQKPEGFVGIDRNLDNVVSFDTRKIHSLQFRAGQSNQAKI